MAMTIGEMIQKLSRDLLLLKRVLPEDLLSQQILPFARKWENTVNSNTKVLFFPLFKSNANVKPISLLCADPGFLNMF